MKRVYGTFKKKDLKAKKNKARKLDRRIPFSPGTGLAANSLLVFLGFMSDW